MESTPSVPTTASSQPASSSTTWASQTMASVSAAAPDAKAPGSAASASDTAHTPLAPVPQSTYPYISTAADSDASRTMDGVQPKQKSLATPTAGVGSPSNSFTPKLPSPPTGGTPSYSSFLNSSERARLLRSSRKLGRLLGATPVILGPGDELLEKDGTNTVFSLSTSDLHAATPDAPSKTSSPGLGEKGTNSGAIEAGKLRGFILAMKALDGDILHGGKHSKARSKARGKENRERVKALAREAEEATRHEKEKEEKRAKRMSAPPTPTSFRLPSPPSMRPSFFSKDSFASAVSTATSGDTLRESVEIEETASWRTTKLSGDYVQSSRRSRSKSRTQPGEERSGASSPIPTTRKSADSTATTASRSLGHRRVQTETNASIPPLPSSTMQSISATPISHLSSMSAPASPNPSTSASAALAASMTPSASAYASASEESDEGPRTPGGMPDGSMGAARAGVDVMDVLEEYKPYNAPPATRALARSANIAEEEDLSMGDDERRFARLGEASSDTDDDELDDDFEARELGVGDSGRPTFVDPWDPTRSPIEPIFGGVSDRAYSSSATRDERAARRRRLAKLTRYLGEQVPTELILQSGTGVGPRHAHVRSEPVIGMGAAVNGRGSQFGRGVAMGLPECIEEAAASKEWEAPSQAASAKLTRRISVVAAKKLLPHPLAPSTPVASAPSPSVSFPVHPAFSPPPSTSAAVRDAAAGPAEKKPKRQRSLGKLVSLRAHSEASPSSVSAPLPEAPEPFSPILSPVASRHDPEDDFADHPSHIASTASFASNGSYQERTERSRSPVPKDVAVSRKRSLAMGMLSGRDRQLVEDEWTPEAYEDVVSRLRKLR